MLTSVSAWTTWKRIKQLREDRSDTLKMLDVFIYFVRKLQLDRTAVFYFEWPKLVDGWRLLPQAIEVRTLLPFTAAFNGCAYGLRRSDNGALFCEQCMVATSFAQRLN